ncbi:hypothetical protein OC861_002759 [Tilletia horrida]|nr:hypothetical protein OC861_002759 [Tilletia horrida]
MFKRTSHFAFVAIWITLTVAIDPVVQHGCNNIRTLCKDKSHGNAAYQSCICNKFTFGGQVRGT